MQTEILYRPSFSLAVVKLDSNEMIRTEAGAMVSMSPDLVIETQARGGVLKSLARSVLGGESFFINTYTAPSGGGEITLAPTLPGDIITTNLSNAGLLVQSGSYLASSDGITVDTKWGGAKTFFGGEGLFMLRISGSGTLILSSYGAIHTMTLAQGQKYVVDTTHLVAFDEGIGYQVKAVGGLKSTLFSGEGLVVELTGPGTVALQTRSERAFLSWLIPKLPRPSSS
ncbi:MAG: TIGR00266 family protein [Deltaproteobacteria bacterium]|jgi:uncharacterized protein (TIGR00266 family)|nr:TIGR00266 family protein [Candidatus Zymogenaceae bacterium]